MVEHGGQRHPVGMVLQPLHRLAGVRAHHIRVHGHRHGIQPHGMALSGDQLLHLRQCGVRAQCEHFHIPPLLALPIKHIRGV